MELPKAGDKIRIWQYGAWLTLEAAKNHAWYVEIVYICESVRAEPFSVANMCVKFGNGVLWVLDVKRNRGEIILSENECFLARDEAHKKNYEFEVIN